MKERIPERIGRGLCRAIGTGECAPICLSHSSIHTRDGGCPERTKVHRRNITEVLYATGFGGAIDRRVEGGLITGMEAHLRAVDVNGVYMSFAEISSIPNPGVSDEAWRVIINKARRLKGVG